jgi:hypothetical protein
MPTVGSGGAQWFTEWLATFALVVTILSVNTVGEVVFYRL